MDRLYSWGWRIPFSKGLRLLRKHSSQTLGIKMLDMKDKKVQARSKMRFGPSIFGFCCLGIWWLHSSHSAFNLELSTYLQVNSKLPLLYNQRDCERFLPWVVNSIGKDIRDVGPNALRVAHYRFSPSFSERVFEQGQSSVLSLRIQIPWATWRFYTWLLSLLL